MWSEKKRGGGGGGGEVRGTQTPTTSCLIQKGKTTPCGKGRMAPFFIVSIKSSSSRRKKGRDVRYGVVFGRKKRKKGNPRTKGRGGKEKKKERWGSRSLSIAAGEREKDVHAKKEGCTFTPGRGGGKAHIKKGRPSPRKRFMTPYWGKKEGCIRFSG